MLFIFDENFPVSFVEGFSLLEKANRRSTLSVDVAQHASMYMGRIGASDEEIIEAAKSKNAVIITHDSDFKKIKHYKPLPVKHRVGYVYFKIPKGRYEYWDIVKAFINCWENLKKEISQSTHPFAKEVNARGQINNLHF